MQVNYQDIERVHLKANVRSGSRVFTSVIMRSINTLFVSFAAINLLLEGTLANPDVEGKDIEVRK